MSIAFMFSHARNLDASYRIPGVNKKFFEYVSEIETRSSTVSRIFYSVRISITFSLYLWLIIIAIS